MNNVSDAKVLGSNGDPGPHGHWRITPQGDGSFTLSTEQWPAWYIYMNSNSDGDVIGYNGDPGPQGYFKLSCELEMET